MFDKQRLQDVLIAYKEHFASTWWENEKYKWEAINTFQENWDIDAHDFADMLDRALSGTKNLLASVHYFPAKMVSIFAHEKPDEVRRMFENLFDERKDLAGRFEEFKKQSAVRLEECASFMNENYGESATNSFQNETAISIYLWLCYPDKYYIYKFREIKTVSDRLGSNYYFKQGAYSNNIRNFYAFYDEVCEEVQKDAELKGLLQSHLSKTCYSDPQCRTLTMDVCYYIAKYYPDTQPDTQPDPNISPERRYWWLNANPKIWSYSGLAIGETEFYTLFNENGNKRRIFQNFLDAKAGDMVIGYEATPVKQIVAICQIVAEQDGKEIKFKKTENLTTPIDYAQLKACPELSNFDFFSNPTGSLFSLRKEEYDFIMDVIREANPLRKNEGIEKYNKENYLAEVFMDQQKYDKLVAVLRNKKNIILQGAPGVGKTFAAKRLAYSLMGEKDDSRIEFVQFHQNYSYEDFMMGYKPSENGFEMKRGVFYKFCNKAKSQPDKDFFFIIDEINRGNMSKIFGELLMMIENDYRGVYVTLAYDEIPFAVPKNLYIIGMMNTADRSLAMIDYALRRRFSFIEMTPAFNTKDFTDYQNGLGNTMFNQLIEKVKELNEAITNDNALGKGFCIGHSYFSNWKKDECTKEKMLSVVEFDIVPMLEEYWFDDNNKVQQWSDELRKVLE